MYRLGSLIFSPVAAVVAGVLWLADPVTIGLGHIDGVDLPLALAAALTSLALLRWVRRRDAVSLLLAGGAAGLAVATGVAGLVVLAAVVIVVAVTARGTGWRQRSGGLEAASAGDRARWCWLCWVRSRALSQSRAWGILASARSVCAWLGVCRRTPVRLGGRICLARSGMAASGGTGPRVCW